MGLTQFDEWQKLVLEIKKGNLIVLGGRQIGKSFVFSRLEGNYLLETPNAHLLIVSGVERQATELFDKILNYIEETAPEMIKRKKDRPLKDVFRLKNGSVCRTEPLGTAGDSARRHTVTRLVMEEMQLIPEDAFAALTPMLFTTGGDIHMLGTADATSGYVYDRLSDPDFKVFRVDAEEVAEKRPEPQRTIMLTHLEKERKRLTEAEYMREYKAIPSDRIRQIFPDSLIKKIQSLKRRPQIRAMRRYDCGIDPAGMGEDEGAISIFDTTNNEKFEQVDFIITEKKLTTEMVDIIIAQENLYHFKNIFVDDGGVGFGVFSGLMSAQETKRKTIALNNASRPLNRDETNTKKILKEDLYMNLLYLMEKGQIALLDDPEIRESLKSVKFEYDLERKKLTISSTYNHPVESIIRGVWGSQMKRNPVCIF